MANEIVVYGKKPMVKVDDSNVTFGNTHDEIKDMPIDSAVRAATFKPGIVTMGDQIYAQGSRPDETKVMYNGVSITNPLDGQSVDLGVLGTAGSDVTVGAMDPEYGDVQAAVINLTTREGSDHFKGAVRYATEDFGRVDKTYGKMDLSLIHISEPTRLLSISYAVFCLKKKK